MAKIDMEIEQMHCGACVRRVTQTLNSLPGTHADSVRLGAAQLTTDADPAAVVEALAHVGFPARITTVQP
jgi:copper chaperone